MPARPTIMGMNNLVSPSPAPREREGPSPQGWEGEGVSSLPGPPSPASLREAPSPAMRERGFNTGLYRLLAWLSPGFPTGAFCFSNGLEAAPESGAARDRPSLQEWIGAVIAW